MSGSAGSLYRFDFWYNSNLGDSFYTSNPQNESLGAYTFRSSNIWNLFQNTNSQGINGQGVQPVYRFWSPVALIGDHLFKFGASPPSNDYYLEGVIGAAYTSSGANRQPIYRYYNPSTGDHRYTPGSARSAYIYEGIAWWSPVLVYGCGDSNANNYNGYVNQSSSGCNYSVVGCMDPNASNYNPSANINSGCSYPTPSLTLNINPSSIIQGQNATISWSTYNSTSRSISGIGNVSSSGSQTISPSSTSTYTLSGNYYSYTSANTSKTITVYQPPSITFTVDNSQINAGGNTILRWNVSGSVSTVTISPAIGSTNISSTAVITPTSTTTYTLFASGPGGTGSAIVTVTVSDPPTVTINGPISVNYGDNIIISHQMTKATTTYQLQISEIDLDDNVTTASISPVNLGPGPSANSTYTHVVAYHTRGPRAITYTLYGVGQSGLSDTDQIYVPINIDQTPNAIDIPSSEDKLRDEEPIITPNVEVTTEQIVVEDIDVPVEVKSNYPVQVEIENGEVWYNIRQI